MRRRRNLLDRPWTLQDRNLQDWNLQDLQQVGEDQAAQNLSEVQNLSGADQAAPVHKTWTQSWRQTQACLQDLDPDPDLDPDLEPDLRPHSQLLFIRSV